MVFRNSKLRALWRGKIGFINTLWTTDFGKVDPLSVLAMMVRDAGCKGMYGALMTALFVSESTVTDELRRVHNSRI